MKKLLFVFAFIGILFLGNVCTLKAQEQDPLAIDDSVSIDKMDPVFYEDQGDQQKSNTSTIIIILAAILVAGGVTFYVLKKKKKKD